MNMFLLNRFVHLDLKGAPLKVSYMEKVSSKLELKMLHKKKPQKSELI